MQTQPRASQVQVAESRGIKGLTPQQRAERGRAARALTGRRALGRWAAAPDRPDPIDLLRQQESRRVQALVPLRHLRMSATPFTFYRGSALVMTWDLASAPDSGLYVRACGDAHLSNFGMFGAPDRTPVFDLNDFDETHPGPFEWDVKRLATSFVLAAADGSFPPTVGAQAARTVAASYQQFMASFARMPELQVWYERVDAEDLARWSRDRGGKAMQRRVEHHVSRAHRRDTWSAISRMTEVVDGRRRFVDRPPVLVRAPEGSPAREAVAAMYEDYLPTLAEYRRLIVDRYEVVDIGHRVVGVGSVGLLAWVVLLEGRDARDLMVLQIKQADASVLEPFTLPSEYDQHGLRVVAGQRILQATGDPFLGWVTGRHGRHYYVRQLRDMKWSPDVGTFSTASFLEYATLCGYVLARAHARSGDSIAIASYLGSSDAFAAAIEGYATAYAGQVALDYAVLMDGLASGRVEAAEPSADPRVWHDLMFHPPGGPAGGS